MKKNIAIIGCGNMGEALLKGLLRNALFKKTHIIVSDVRTSRRNYIKKLYKIKVASSSIEAALKSDIIILAVKPQDVVGLLQEIGLHLKNKLIISIAAGITTDTIRKKSNAKRIVRAMPNTPALVGCGITAISSSKGVGASDLNIADNIFRCVGEAVRLKERYIDAVTAVSGSGPAYFFLLTEAMTKAAVSLGIDNRLAKKLTAQTLFGASVLQHVSRLEPSRLREKVTSKGGTTEAALKVFKRRGLEKIVADAIKAAAKRAKELSG
ncbi:MAG: pyrroline-5-carboxylate reductase [Candidatus Omnitrophota bacterium]